jgi:hypothetical protein
VDDFEAILGNRINNMLSQSGLTLNECYTSSVLTDWYVDLKINGQQIIKEPFYRGYGITATPSDTQWRFALIQYLPQLINYQYAYVLNGNTLTISNLLCLEDTTPTSVSLDIGINININCMQ